MGPGGPMKLLFLSAALATGALAPAAAQEPGAVRESAEVTLVEVPVRVVDRDGEPVRGPDRGELHDPGRRTAARRSWGSTRSISPRSRPGTAARPSGRAPPLPDPLRLLVLAPQVDRGRAQGGARLRPVGDVERRPRRGRHVLRRAGRAAARDLLLGPRAARPGDRDRSASRRGANRSIRWPSPSTRRPSPRWRRRGTAATRWRD